MSLPQGANIRYASKQEVKTRYQNTLKRNQNLAKKEQDWVDMYLAPVIDFMGDEDVWNAVISDVKVKGAGGRASTRGLPSSDYPIAIFSGAHWYSRKAKDNVWFDAYDHYQIPGTNQFCQTYAMMYLMDTLPIPRPDGWTRYYEYTRAALEFAKMVISTIAVGAYKKEMLRKVNMCLKKSNACLNVIEYPR